MSGLVCYPQSCQPIMWVSSSTKMSVKSRYSVCILRLDLSTIKYYSTVYYHGRRYHSMSGVIRQSVAVEAFDLKGYMRGSEFATVMNLIEDQAQMLVADMLVDFDGLLKRDIIMGVPVFTPRCQKVRGALVITAPGEGVDNGVAVSALLAGFALSFHAAEYLYFGGDRALKWTQAIKAYKYTLQALALTAAIECLHPVKANKYQEILGVDL